ncbi:SRPBCC domain-containing protein [Candidatus Parcubacteria bacterium]|nr:SRPBCC domain-containing protein [Candidatus Parcubacteria bacterium]
MNKTITVQSIINAPIEKVWEMWTKPEHIVNWAFASDDWEAPEAENDVRTGGTFKTVMAAKDGSSKFDFGGTYTNVKEHELIEYDMNGEPKRHVKIVFTQTPEGVNIVQTFDPENENSEEMQRSGWQSILDNFKKYTESKS